MFFGTEFNFYMRWCCSSRLLENSKIKELHWQPHWNSKLCLKIKAVTCKAGQPAPGLGFAPWSAATWILNQSINSIQLINHYSIQYTFIHNTLINLINPCFPCTPFFHVHPVKLHPVHYSLHSLSLPVFTTYFLQL